MTDPDAVARDAAEAMWAGDEASRGLGMTLDGVGPGHAVLSMTVAETMLNGHGMCHGGFIFALADSAMAFASNSHGAAAVAQHCAITFLRPARCGERLTAEAVERIRHGRTGLYDARVTGTEGDVVAEFRGQARLLRREPEAAPSPPAT